MSKKEISVLSDLLTCDLKHILDEINSDKYLWNGTVHGDSVTNYQSRKCLQTALVLIITSRIMSMDGEIDDIIVGNKHVGITQDEAKDLFYDYIRKLGNQYSGDSATDEIRFDFIPNLYTYVANYIP